MHSSLITDLSLILIVASAAILLFKWLKQPVVLGYIVAGFLVGPHMRFFPSVVEVESIQTWAEIGVIFLMFSLGLEFSFKKVFQMGSKPIMAALMVMGCMMAVGSAVGTFFQWGAMNSLFLGGILAISSTTIIYKAFDELGLRQQSFVTGVLSVLVLEDILGILLMVALSAISVSRTIQGDQLMMSFLQLGFFLLLWFVVGVFLVPLLLKKTKRWLNRETLLIVSIGLCFLLVYLAEKAGYSAAFGAFMMGSILAETMEAEKIERTIAPLKDLFGAIFFVSVGMMVDPAVLVEYWLPITVICLSVILGQMVFGTGSFLASGSPLKAAMRSGFALAQIGEFSFIIAQLGVSLKVTNDFLYPVTVAVSIITTFLTPYMIRAADPAYRWVAHVLPNTIVERLDVRGQNEVQRVRSLWRTLLVALLGQTTVYMTLTIGAIGLSSALFLPLCRSLFTTSGGNLVGCVVTLFVISPFLRALVMRKHNNEVKKELCRRNKINRYLLQFVFLLRYAMATFFVFYILHLLSPFALWIHLLLAVSVVALLIASRWVKYRSIRLERTFMQNLGTRERASRSARPAYARGLQSRDMHLSSVTIPAESTWSGLPLRELSFSKELRVLVAAIVRGELRMNIPNGETLVYPGDVLEVISDDTGIAAFCQRLETDVVPTEERLQQRLYLRPLTIAKGSPFCGKTLSESGIREDYYCMVVGFETLEETIEIIDAERSIKQGDKLWLVGEKGSLERILKENLRNVSKEIGEEKQVAS